MEYTWLGKNLRLSLLPFSYQGADETIMEAIITLLLQISLKKASAPPQREAFSVFVEAFLFINSPQREATNYFLPISL